MEMNIIYPIVEPSIIVEICRQTKLPMSIIEHATLVQLVHFTTSPSPILFYTI